MSSTRTRSVSRAGARPIQPLDPLLAKLDGAASLPAEAANGVGRGRFGVVHGYPLGTGRDRREWYASGTVGEDELAWVFEPGSSVL
jgi:hypothetical protein